MADDPPGDVLTVPPVSVWPEAAALTLARVENDHCVVDLWLRGRAPGIQRAYAADVAAFRAHVGCALEAATLHAVHDFMNSLASLVPATQARRLSAIKSLLAFGHPIGYPALRHRRGACQG